MNSCHNAQRKQLHKYQASIATTNVGAASCCLNLSSYFGQCELPKLPTLDMQKDCDEICPAASTCHGNRNLQHLRLQIACKFTYGIDTSVLLQAHRDDDLDD